MKNKIFEKNKKSNNYYANEELNYYQLHFKNKNVNYFAETNLEIKSKNAINRQCYYYLNIFLFKNKFYKHFENSKKDRRANSSICSNHFFKKPKTYPLYPFIETSNFQSEKIIKSLFDSAFEIDIDQTFRYYYYVMTTIKLKFEKKKSIIII